MNPNQQNHQIHGQNIVACVWDFDKTLIPGYMQKPLFQHYGINEKAFIKSSKNPEYKIKVGQEVLSIDPKYFRPTEVDLLIGDATKAKEKLNWTPEIGL